MWRGARLMLAGFLLLTAATTHAEPDDTPSNSIAEEVASVLSPSRWLDPQLRVILGAMERLDELLRTTIPTMDRFQCVERFMCSLAAGQFTSSQPEVPTGQFPGFDPTFQQGLILNPSTIQQSFSGLVQNPAGLQQGLQGLVQNPAALQQGLQGLVQGQGLQGLVQNPGLQQSFVQGLPSFQNPAFQGVQGGGSPFLGGTTFQNTIPLFRENPDASARVSVTGNTRPHSVPQATTENIRLHSVPPAATENTRLHSVPQAVTGNTRPHSVPQAVRRRRPPLRRRPQRRGFFDFLGRLGRRKKRSIFDDLLSGFGSARFMGVLDQMMTSYSFYPYTHAAYMGLSGSPDSCETLYASCPSTAEQMLDLFNNIHKYYPDGIPYKENLPWPLSALLP